MTQHCGNDHGQMQTDTYKSLHHNDDTVQYTREKKAQPEVTCTMDYTLFIFVGEGKFSVCSRDKTMETVLFHVHFRYITLAPSCTNMITRCRALQPRDWISGQHSYTVISKSPCVCVRTLSLSLSAFVFSPSLSVCDMSISVT